MAPKVGIVGMGRIGTHLHTLVIERDWEVNFIATRSQLMIGGQWVQRFPMPFYNLTETLCTQGQPDIVFICLPPLGDRGQTEMDFAVPFVLQNIPVVFAGKEALAFMWHILSKFKHLLGWSAACGGETRLLDFIAKYAKGPVLINASLNASWNFLLTCAAQGIEQKVACTMAEKAGYLEPDPKGGAKEPHLRFRLQAELHDHVMKMCVLLNTTLLRDPPFITPDAMVMPVLSKEDLDYIWTNAAHYRYVATFTNRQLGLNSHMLRCGLKGRCQDWSFKAGFRYMPEGSDWIPDGPTAAVCISGVDLGPFFHAGKGAGPETVHAMLYDAERLLRI